MYTIGLLFIAFIFPFICKMIFPHKITWKEYLLHTGVALMCVGVTYFVINRAATYDVELWSGEVTKKYSEKVSCEHSYQCNCVTNVSVDSKGNRTSTQVCQTCYDHSYDIDWVVKSNIGTDLINRVDRQGVKEPPRFSKVEIGEPFVLQKSFVNYIKASPNTLFKNSDSVMIGYEAVLPAYPEVYDYYRVQRMFSYGVNVDNTLNLQLNLYMKKWGPQKQANVIVVFVSEKYTQAYFHALNTHWLGGKKNDVIVVTQIDDAGKVGWVRVASRAERKEFDKSVEFDVSNMGTFKTEDFLKILDTNIMNRFEREDFHKYEYLLADFTPSTVAMVIGLIFAFMVNIGMAFLTYKEDIFK